MLVATVTNYVFAEDEITLSPEDEVVSGKLISKFAGRSSFARSVASCAGQFGPVCGDCSTLWVSFLFIISGIRAFAECLLCFSRVLVTLHQLSLWIVAQCIRVAHIAWITRVPVFLIPMASVRLDLRAQQQDTSQVQTSTTCCLSTINNHNLHITDPTDCMQYYFCSGPLGSSRVYQCPDSFVYNPQNNQCKRLLWATDCAQVNCIGKQNQFVAYSGDSSLYAVCMVKDGISTPVMLKCGDPNHEFNEANQRCELVCREEGRIPDKSDCHGYFECFRTQTGYGSSKGSCMAGFSFDAATKVCVPGDCTD